MEDYKVLRRDIKYKKRKLAKAEISTTEKRKDKNLTLNMDVKVGNIQAEKTRIH